MLGKKRYDPNISHLEKPSSAEQTPAPSIKTSNPNSLVKSKKKGHKKRLEEEEKIPLCGSVERIKKSLLYDDESGQKTKAFAVSDSTPKGTNWSTPGRRNEVGFGMTIKRGLINNESYVHTMRGDDVQNANDCSFFASLESVESFHAEEESVD